VAEHVQGMPILVAHGDADWVVPVELVWYSKAMGAGARDWFADAPQVSEGSVLREPIDTLSTIMITARRRRTTRR